jgi:biofilm PGA synthesis N-glycosyltransferase PgaC
MFTPLLASLVILFGIVNLLRIVLYMVGADWHDVKHQTRLKRAQAMHRRRPRISVIIPAHNEENVILRAVASVYESDYPYKEVIVMDDGSTDRTAGRVEVWRQLFHPKALRIISQPNGGKATAINRGVLEATGSLIVVLDADSMLHPQALTNLVDYFKDPEVALVASNVKIMDATSPLKLAQKFEYLICYRMKRAQTAFNIEYIVGGIGSAFRRSVALKIGLYDTDTITEDIDFTMKVLRRGRGWKAIYAPRVITYTEPVQTFGQLIKQRFRWKYGRSQVFIKHWQMFFNLSRKYDKRLTTLALPYAIYSDLTFLVEPLIVGFIFGVVIVYHDWFTLLSAYLVMTSYLILNVLAEETEDMRTKLKLIPVAFLQYPLSFALSAAEYSALIMTLFKTRSLFTGQTGASWTHVTRSGATLKADQIHRI